MKLLFAIAFPALACCQSGTTPAEPIEAPEANSEVQFAADFERLADGVERQLAPQFRGTAAADQENTDSIRQSSDRAQRQGKTEEKPEGGEIRAKVDKEQSEHPNVEKENQRGATVQREGNSTDQAQNADPLKLAMQAITNVVERARASNDAYRQDAENWERTHTINAAGQALQGQTPAASEEESSTRQAPKADFAMLAMRPVNKEVAHKARIDAKEQDTEDAEPAQSDDDADFDDRSRTAAALMHEKNLDQSAAADQMLGEIKKELDSVIAPGKHYEAIFGSKLGPKLEEQLRENIRAENAKHDEKLREKIRAENKKHDEKHRERIRAESTNGGQAAHKAEMGGSNTMKIKVDKESHKLERLRSQRSALKVENKQLRGLRKVLKRELHVERDISELKAENKKLREENVALQSHLIDG